MSTWNRFFARKTRNRAPGDAAEAASPAPDGVFREDGLPHGQAAGRGRAVPAFLFWTPLAVAAVYWHLGLALLDSSNQQLVLSEIMQQLPVGPASFSGSASASPDGSEGLGLRDDSQLDPVRHLVGLRLVLPRLRSLEPDAAAALSRQVDALEQQLADRLADEDVGENLTGTLRALDQKLYALALDNLGRAEALQNQLLTLLVLFTLLGVVVAGLSVRSRRVEDARPAWALGGLEQKLFENAPGAVVVSDGDDRILAVNDAYTRMTGYGQDEVAGQDITFNHSGQQDQNFYAAMRGALSRKGRWVGEFWLRNKEGEAFADKVTRLVLSGRRGEPAGFLTLSMELVSSDESKRLMLWQAHHDTLTKLPNRNLFQERLTRVLLRAHEKEFIGALISIDLDRFKIVNDSFGPARGDQILMEAAYRIALCVDETDTVARLGSDHFVVLTTQASDYGDVERLARGILAEIQRPFQLEDKELFITSSIGVSVISQDGDETGELLQKADAARIQVKEHGGNNVAFFEPSMNARAERRLELESALRKAISGDQLVLFYQPLVDVKRGVVSGAEALLRWQHPELGLVSPGEFIPVAEDTGLIVEIGRWVVQESQRQLRLWQEQGLEHMRVSLNVSAVQLRRAEDADALLDLLEEAEDNGITLEITESALMENSAGVSEFLKRARSLGSQVALDDFGTGFSSLGYLRNFEFDVLKIDKTFIDELANTRDYGLVASIVSMGRILGMRVVAEGVETGDQVKRLKQIGCDYVQGFYFSKPLPAEEFFRFVSGGELREVG